MGKKNDPIRRAYFKYSTPTPQRPRNQRQQLQQPANEPQPQQPQVIGDLEADDTDSETEGDDDPLASSSE